MFGGIIIILDLIPGIILKKDIFYGFIILFKFNRHKYSRVQVWLQVPNLYLFK